MPTLPSSSSLALRPDLRNALKMNGARITSVAKKALRLTSSCLLISTGKLGKLAWVRTMLRTPPRPVRVVAQL